LRKFDSVAKFVIQCANERANDYTGKACQPLHQQPVIPPSKPHHKVSCRHMQVQRLLLVAQPAQRPSRQASSSQQTRKAGSDEAGLVKRNAM
jgi:hypothetical protein